MTKSEHPDAARGLAPDLVAHLEQAFGWSQGQALDALGAYLLNTEAGRALCHELDSTVSPLEAA
jgi:hypothetical protein